MRTIIAAALFLPTIAAADGYADHKGVTPWRDQPCTVVIGAIDAGAALAAMPAQAVTWGFLLGYDTANGGLHGNEETTLVRLRKACAASPETPALTLLEGFLSPPTP